MENTNIPAVIHEPSCDDCLADERGIQYAPDQNGQWYAYYAHDTYGDGHWKGATYQVIAGPESTETVIRAKVIAGSHTCIDCQTLELDEDKPRCESCQEVQDEQEREEKVREMWADYNERGGRPERDTRHSDYMAACGVK